MARRPVPTRPVVGDLLAGISVSVVLIPQAVAYATLAGLPPRFWAVGGVCRPHRCVLLRFIPLPRNGTGGDHLAPGAGRIEWARR